MLPKSFRAESAGMRLAKELTPSAVQVMKEETGVEISGHISKIIAEELTMNSAKAVILECIDKSLILKFASASLCCGY